MNQEDLFERIVSGEINPDKTQLSNKQINILLKERSLPCLRKSIWLKGKGFLDSSFTTWFNLNEEWQQTRLSLEDWVSHKEFSKSDTLISRTFKSHGLPQRNLNLDQDSRQAKRIKTNQIKFGVANPAQIPGIFEKIKETCFKKYGVFHHMQDPSILERAQEKSSKPRRDRFESLCLINNFEIIKYSKKYVRSTENLCGKEYGEHVLKHNVCGHVSRISTCFERPLCLKCCPPEANPGRTSHLEIELHNYISSLGYESKKEPHFITLSDTRSHKAEIDIYIPSKDIGFEINGLYWHSQHPNTRGSVLRYGKKYHSLKTSSCWKQKQLRLFHIWSYQDVNVWKDKIKALLGINQIRIGARTLKVEKKLCSVLFENHLHGMTRSFLTLVLSGSEEYAAISFRRTRNPMEVEIARYVVKPGYSILGGFQKLLKSALSIFKERYPQFTTLITYADRDFTPVHEDCIYERAGFQYLGDSGPILRYTNFKEVKDRRAFQKRKLSVLFPDTNGLNKTANEILAENGWYPFYNSGNFKYKMEITSP